MKIRTETVHRVDAFDVDAFIQETYGVSFNFAADQESGNDAAHTFTVDGEVDEWAQQEVDSVLEKGYGNYAALSMLNYMAKQGLIPTGEYVVEVSW